MTPRSDRVPSAGAADLLTVYGTVVTVDGTPIPEAAIDLDPLDINGAAFETILVFSDAQGQYRWDVRPGRYQLRVMAVGYHAASQELVVAAGTPVTATTVLATQTSQ
jgi:hypothetical protein